jgi:hypothetical protein
MKAVGTNPRVDAASKFGAIDRELDNDHADCLADRDLIARAQFALPILRSVLAAKSRDVKDFAADAAQMVSIGAAQRQWYRSGGQAAYAEEIGLQNDAKTLERLIAGARPSSWYGWVQRHEVERILRRAAREVHARSQ